VDSYYRPTRAEISLDALRHNIEAFRSAIPQSMKLLASVKGNAYGHGAVETAREAVQCGADYLGVAFLDEAVQLRRAGITAPILVLGYTPPEGIPLAAELGVTLTVFSEDLLRALSELPAETPKVKVHVKIDSGMGRLGLIPEREETVHFIERLHRLPAVHVEGMFTHYSCADERDKCYTREQHRRFSAIVETLRGRGVDIPLIHAGNTATGIDTPELSYSMVRLGIGMYGLYPSEEVNKQRVDLEPVMSLKTAVVWTKTAAPRSGISYGAKYMTQREERIGTLPVGYADGYTRMLSGRAEALVRGQRTPVLGNICMDQCMISLEDIPGAQVEAGEEVVLIGKQGNDRITADELAVKLDTINYEITCMIAGRVPRVYTRNGVPVGIVNPLLG